LPAVTHIAIVNCAEIITDRPKWPWSEIFGIESRFQQSKFRPPRFKEFSAQRHQIWYPHSNAQLYLLFTSLA